MNSKRATLVALVGLGFVIGTTSQAFGDAQKPTEEEVEINEIFVAESSTPATLPTTASNLPLIGIFGMVSLAIASLLALVRPRSS